MAVVVPPWEAGTAESKPKKASSTKKKKDGRANNRGGNKKPHTAESEKNASGTRSFAYKNDGVYAHGADHANSIYTPAHAERLLAYFHIDSPVTKTGQDFCAKDGYFVEGKMEGVDFPTIAGFCVQEKIGRVTYHRWANDCREDGSPKYPEFFYANQIVQQVQEQLLLTNGLKGYYNSGFAKFVLNTYHDKIEKTARDVNMKGNINLVIDSDDNNL